uniref:3-hydroxyisobutyryl-CoA hydrolase n=1 Tax=Pyramimonas obovata TaxID=1411642 RepID=A0A7S0QZA1_9CHLO
MSPNQDEEVVWEDSVSCRTAYLNRPKALNSLSTGMCRSIKQLFETWDQKDHIKAIMLKGVGKSFCAGGDVRNVILSARDGGDKKKEALEFFREEYDMNFKLSLLQKPLISFLDGYTMGGGVGVCIYGRFRVATENSVAAMPECAIGLFPDIGSMHWLSKMPCNLGVMLALTGYRLKGRDVAASGIATHFVPSDSVRAVERRIEAVAPYSTVEEDHTVICEAVREFIPDAYDEELRTEMPEDSVFNFLPQIERVFAGSTVEEILQTLDAELAAARPQAEAAALAEFLQELKESMAAACPLMLKVALRRLRTTNDMRLSEVLKLDYAMVQHSLEDPNFYEGVRARLIDKDNAPKWSPPALEEVTDAMVDKFFSPAPEALALPEEMLAYEEELLRWKRDRASQRLKLKEQRAREAAETEGDEAVRAAQEAAEPSEGEPTSRRSKL